MTLVALLGFLLSLLVGAAAPLAQEKSVAWERYDVQIAVQPSGDLLVTETETVRFGGGPFTKAFREIPLDRTTGITDVQVSEPGQAYQRDARSGYGFTVSRTADNFLRVDWTFPSISDTTRTFVLSYRVQGALRYYDGGDQLYWQAVYADRGGPVSQATVTVTLPQDVPQDKLVVGANPQSGASARVTGPRTVSFTARSLADAAPLEVRVQFPHGIVAGSPPPWQAAADREDAYQQNVRPILIFLGLLLGLLILVGGLIGVFLLWSTRGREPRPASVPAELEQPPSELPPGVAGTLVDQQADVQDVLATLLDLGNRGVVRIEEVPGRLPFGAGRDFRISRVAHDDAGLRPFEKTVLDALLAGQESVTVSQMQGRFAAHIPLFQQQLYDESVRAGLFQESPERARKRYRGLALALLGIGVAVFVLGLFVGIAALTSFPGVALAFVGIALLLVARAMGRYTRAGATEAARWRAFGRYLARGDHGGHQQQLEHYLPYSVALGADKEWLRKFSLVGAPAPRWYGPGDGMGRRGYGGVPPVIILPGGGGWGGPRGGPADGGSSSSSGGGGIGIPSPQDASDRAAGGLQNWSDLLADLLNSASDALSRGGGSGGWSGGGGGWGGGGGGGRGGFG